MQKLTVRRKSFNTTTASFYIGVDDLDTFSCNVVNAIRMAEIEVENGDAESSLYLPPSACDFSTGSFIDDPLIASSIITAYVKGMFSLWLTPESNLSFQDILRNILTRFAGREFKNDIFMFFNLIDQSISYVPDFTVDQLVAINSIVFEADYIAMELTTEPRQPTSLVYGNF